MSKQDIHQYYNKLDQYKQYGGSDNEISVRRAFANLLEAYCLPKNLLLVDELLLKSSQKRPDGTVKDALRLDWGHWESKAVHVSLNEEIRKKFELGYPKFNIIFENSAEIVLIQQEQETLRGDMRNAEFLHRVLTAFISYERPEIQEFRTAIEKFKQDIPHIIEALRALIAAQAKTNLKFQQARAEFWELCKESINPDITDFDIGEMLIQHILTAEIFDTVFSDSHFHRENNVAQELERVVNSFFTRTLRKETLAKIDNYYKTIKAEAARIDNHHEKQRFLKVIYENFYKAYNPKGADRLGIVYTPAEIVKFMIESTDYLLEKHFNTSLAEKGVEILDPATGTGTFITDLIEYIPRQYLEHKYRHEIHANELAILPYYIANLNIEYTYQQKMGQYVPFENIVFVDTLDNLGFMYQGKQGSFAGFGLSAENLARIKAQNERRISVIIGNPPYNAKQEWYNDFNPNRKYAKIDERIKESYVKHGTAQNKNQLYDMYFRFFRWASDRLNENGVLCFITNHSYIHAQAFDGFRKAIAKEFDYAYIVDLGGDIRNRQDSHVPTGNVFGIITGVAIGFFIKSATRKNETCIVSYIKVPDNLTKDEKLEYLSESHLKDIAFSKIANPQNSFWLNITTNDFDSLLPLINKTVKGGESEKAIFKLFSRGVETTRDEWVFDFSHENLARKVKFFIQKYNESIRNQTRDESIKWSSSLESYFQQKREAEFNENLIIKATYRPYTAMYFYGEKILNHRLTQNHYDTFGNSLNQNDNLIIGFISGVTKPFSVLVFQNIIDLNTLSPAAGGTQCLPLYRYDGEGQRVDNITDWALGVFRERYKQPSPLAPLPGGEGNFGDSLSPWERAGVRDITKKDIFHYVYAVLHNPAYRAKYETNLKREFPRIPMYDDFWQWVAWGEALLGWHVHYETIEPYPLERKDKAPSPQPSPKGRGSQVDSPLPLGEGLGVRVTPKLRADKEANTIEIDSETTLHGIPPLAWEYKLGNRSALEWVLDQYKEKTARDETIQAEFNSYRLVDYKADVINLLGRLCTVSVKTMRIVGEMTE